MTSMQSARKAQAMILTAMALAVVAAIGATVGRLGLVFAAISLPLPLFFLWLSADVFRADEVSESRKEPQMVRDRAYGAHVARPATANLPVP